MLLSRCPLWTLKFLPHQKRLNTARWSSISMDSAISVAMGTRGHFRPYMSDCESKFRSQQKTRDRQYVSLTDTVKSLAATL